jgi:hypothetical protein
LLPRSEDFCQLSVHPTKLHKPETADLQAERTSNSTKSAPGTNCVLA